MSRRLRREQKITEDFEQGIEPEDFYSIQLKRIDKPLVWKKSDGGIKIQDLKEHQFDEVLSIFKKYYMTDDVLCRNSKLLQDEESLNCYLNRLRFQLNDLCSIVAIDEKVSQQVKEKIVGILILRIIREEDDTRTFSFVQLIEGEAMQKCMELKNHVNRKVDIFQKMNCDVFLRYYEMCVLPEYKNRRIDYLLMFSALSVAHSFKIPAIGGLFPNYSTQRLAKAIGMQIVSEVEYTSWKDEHGELIFEDPGPGNYSCALMTGEVPPPPPQPLSKTSKDEFQDTNTLPRYHKQRWLAKKLKKEREELDKKKEKQAEKQQEKEKKMKKAVVKAEAQNGQYL
ncbi:hypothetical protein FQR65_LT06596 [Abscondita terminalis]|nr:hypothetical protein FQR65_LT09406 [Abscondita terminalis]KAF5307864.1 hypothetical protein FQR65_LT06596 [Abscondita terminalis]